MNYIKHLSEFYQRLYHDERFSALHASLYAALFQRWNHAKFQNPFPVNRTELMKLAKIGSVNTYIRCLNELHAWHFIEYLPSRNITVGSRIRMISFDNTDDNRLDNTTDNSTETALRHSNKLKKTSLNISQTEVEEFFELKNSGKGEAQCFFNHYQANGWMSGGSKIKNWQSVASKWISSATNAALQTHPSRAKKSSKPAVGKHFVNTDKHYDEAL